MSDIRQYEIEKELSEMRTSLQVLTLQQARLADDADSSEALQDKINELQKREIEKHKEWIQEIIYNNRDGLAFEVDRMKEREKKRDATDVRVKSLRNSVILIIITQAITIIVAIITYNLKK